jgi:flagellar hook-length control protein FliK
MDAPDLKAGGAKAEPGAEPGNPAKPAKTDAAAALTPSGVPDAAAVDPLNGIKPASSKAGDKAAKSNGNGNTQAVQAVADSSSSTPAVKPAPLGEKATDAEILAALPKPAAVSASPGAGPAARAAPAAQSLPPLAPPPSPVAVSDPNVARVARGLQNAIAQRGGSVTLRLQPPELGLVRIELAVVNGTANVRFQADDESVRMLLSHQMGNLRHALEGHGLSVERMDVQTMPGVATPDRQADGNPGNGRSRGQFFSQRQGGGSAREPRNAREEPESFSQALVNTIA